jgi:AraC family transcriptional regulator
MRSHLLAHTSLARVYDVQCPGRDSAGEERADGPELLLVRRGGFAWRDAAGRATADAGAAVFVPAGSAYTVSHFAPGGDRCTVLALTPAAFAWAGRFDRTRPVRLLAPHAHLLHRRLANAGATGGDALAIDELVTALLGEALGPPAESPRHSARAATRIAHRELAAHVRRTLAADPLHAWTIGALAAHVGASPFHLCRVFRRETGVPIHRYQLRLKLLAALDEALDAGVDLTQAALDAGFASPSHFASAFAAQFDMPPSRALARSKRARS